MLNLFYALKKEHQMVLTSKPSGLVNITAKNCGVKERFPSDTHLTLRKTQYV